VAQNRDLWRAVQLSLNNCFGALFLNLRTNRRLEGSDMAVNSSVSSPIREQLVDLSRNLRNRVWRLGDEAFRRGGDAEGGNLSHFPSHLAECGTDEYERELTLRLLEKEDHALTEAAAALARIDSGAFGRCEECEKAIPPERLEAVPYTRHCIDCARRLEETDRW
jgi:DnaK suppressor protein